MLSFRGAIVLGVSLAAFVVSLPLTVPLAGFAFNNWQLGRLMNSVSEAEFIDRTKDLPEVEAFLTKFPQTKPFMMIDYKVIILYTATECELTGERCEGPRPHVAYLGIVMDNWSGYPAKSQFSCHDGHIPSYPVRSDDVLERIGACDLESS
jgi:hypothetical protein